MRLNSSPLTDKAKQPLHSRICIPASPNALPCNGSPPEFSRRIRRHPTSPVRSMDKRHSVSLLFPHGICCRLLQFRCNVLDRGIPPSHTSGTLPTNKDTLPAYLPALTRVCARTLDGPHIAAHLAPSTLRLYYKRTYRTFQGPPPPPLPLSLEALHLYVYTVVLSIPIDTCTTFVVFVRSFLLKFLVASSIARYVYYYNIAIRACVRAHDP